MAKEFKGAVPCGGNWLNQPKNLFASSPCSLGTNDVAHLDWPVHDTIESSSTGPDDWNRDLFREMEPPVDSGEFYDSSAGILPFLLDTNNSDYDQTIHNSIEFLPTFPATSPSLNPPFTTQYNHLPPSMTQPHMYHVGPNKTGGEPAVKRARIQTSSLLPTFKVRKEKLGDRVTALQQLVSPFGKTDTASVLHEAVEYIKFLHDQVTVLSSPCLEKGSPPLQNRQVGSSKDVEVMQGLTRRGLCLVPISSTFPVTAETTTDFWTPIFGESFK